MSTGRSPAGWGREDDPAAARARILEAAGEVFAEKGVVHVTIADVAIAAGCTRGTVHRHFGDRDALREAFVDHHAAIVGERLLARLRAIEDPGELLTEAVLQSVAAVRADPVLAAWFVDAAVASTSRLALHAEVVRGLVSDLVGNVLRRADASGTLRPGTDAGIVADAVVRFILSLLGQPAPAAGRRSGPANERRLVEQILVAAVLAGPSA